MDVPKNKNLIITIENIDEYEKSAFMYLFWHIFSLGQIGGTGNIIFSCGRGEDCRPDIKIDNKKIPNMNELLAFNEEEKEVIFENYRIIDTDFSQVPYSSNTSYISPNIFYMLMNKKDIINENGMYVYVPKGSKHKIGEFVDTNKNSDRIIIETQ